MAEQSNKPAPQAQNDAPVIERVQELSWALLDEQISQDELAQLDTLLLSSDKARGTYVGCIQLHTELMAHFAARPAPCEATAAAAKSPLLGFLNAGVPPTGFNLPPADEVKS